MTSSPPRRPFRLADSSADPPAPPTGLHDHAMDNLAYIRRTMTQAGSFTAVPGWGGVGMGAVGVTAAVLAPGGPGSDGWLAVWLAAAVAGALVGAWSMARKAARVQVPLAGRAGRKFALALLPTLLAAAPLSLALGRAGLPGLLPGLWLLLYGAGVVAGGAFSVRPVPVMGGGFMALGVVALFGPAPWADLFLGLGFGGLHVAFGAIIGRRHGG